LARNLDNVSEWGDM